MGLADYGSASRDARQRGARSRHGEAAPTTKVGQKRRPNSVLTEELGRSYTTSIVAACNLLLIDDWLFNHNIKLSRSWLDCEEV